MIILEVTQNSLFIVNLSQEVQKIRQVANTQGKIIYVIYNVYVE